MNNTCDTTIRCAQVLFVSGDNEQLSELVTTESSGPLPKDYMLGNLLFELDPNNAPDEKARVFIIGVSKGTNCECSWV